MFQAPFPVLLRLGALNWLLFVGLIALFMYILEDKIGLPSWIWQVALALSLGASVFLSTVSLFCKVAPASVMWRATFVGVVLSPAVLFFGTIGLSYLATTPERTRLLLLLLIGAASATWCLIALGGYRQRIADKRFIEREFLVHDSRIVVRQPLKTDLGPKPISEQSLRGRFSHRALPCLVVGVPLAYPLQRLLSSVGEDSAVLLVLALLGLPLTIYFLGRMTCGAYLWIYKVWQMQRQYGRPVVFDVLD